MEDKIDILTRIFEPSPQQCQTPREDLQLAITLNPDLSKIEQAMEEYAQHQLTEETVITNNRIERLRAVLIILSAKIKDEERQIAYNELDNILVEIANYHKQSLTEETEEGFKEWTDEKCICLTETFIQQIFTHYKLIKREK